MFGRVIAYVRGMVTRRRAERELDEELRFHVEMETHANVERGLSPSEARRQALLALGGIAQTREAARDQRATLVDALVQDTRYALRSFRRDRIFTATALLTLAAGIGTTTSIYSVVDGILFRPLPYGEPDRVVMLMSGDTRTGLAEAIRQDQLEAVSHARSLEAIGAYSIRSEPRLMVVGGRTERVKVGFVSPGFFQVLDVRPSLGRAFRPDEGVPGGEVAVLTSSFWTRRFASDPEVVGRTLAFEDGTATIVGVLPAGFWYPRTTARSAPDVLLARRMAPGQGARAGHFLLGRLRPGIGVREARAEVALLSGRKDSTPSVERPVFVTPLRSQMVAFQRLPLVIILGAVLCLLVIACINVASLIVARGRSRHQELAIRCSLGASRTRLVRQLLTESTLLGLAGSALGVVVSAWTLDLLVSQVPQSLRMVPYIGVDFRALGFSAAVTVGCVLIVGGVPALALSRPRLGQALKSREADGARRWRHGSLLVPVQLALTVVLLVGAGLLGGSFTRLRAVDLGYDVRDIIVADASAGEQRYQTDAAVSSFFARGQRQLELARGAMSVAVAEISPLSSASLSLPASIEGRPKPDNVDTCRVSASYFATLGIPLMQGRLFDDGDEQTVPAFAVVNETMARRFWPDGGWPGRQVVVWKDTPVRIVGVVGDTRSRLRVREEGVRAAVRPTIYLPFQPNHRHRAFLVRMAPGQGDVIGAVKRQLEQLDPEMASEPVPLEAALDAAVATPRFHALVVVVFAAVGLLLAAVGVAGTAGREVIGRTREIGVRLALGAAPGRVVWQLVRQGLAPTLAGLAFGIAGAAGLGALLSAMLFEVAPRDPATLGSSTLLLLVVATLARYLPARRAAKVDPTTALRCE